MVPCMADSLQPVNVRKLKAMPDGNYLTIMQRNGADRRLYLLVEEGKATCIHTNTWLAADPSVQFQTIGNGAFMASARGENTTKTPF